MELKWLEDFLNLAATRNFSASAAERNVTQSAFSRRIRALEMWLGTDLLDRSTYPVRLTENGRAFQESAEEVVRLIHASRVSLGGRENVLHAPATIALTALHSLTMTFLPRWLTALRESLGEMPSRVLAENHALCLQALAEGGYDFMLTYHHNSVPVPLDPARFPHLVVGQDRLAAIASTRHLPLWQNQPSLPLLQYSRGSFLGLLSSVAQEQPEAPKTHVAHVNENSLAEALRFMVLEGHGIAWLPEALVAKELVSGQLVSVAPPLPMEIRLYRNAARSRSGIERIWRAAANYSEPE